MASSACRDRYNSYTLRRRFRQFDQLHTQLRASYRGLPDLPGKGGLLGSSGKDDAARAEGRREALTAYLRTLLADPEVGKCDELISWLELSSTSELFEKLMEKDMHFQIHLAAHSEEHEKLRASLANASAERSAARAALAEREEELAVAAAARATLSVKLRAAEDAAQSADAERNTARERASAAEANAEAAAARADSAEASRATALAEAAAAAERASAAEANAEAAATRTDSAEASRATALAEAAAAAEVASEANAKANSLQRDMAQRVSDAESEMARLREEAASARSSAAAAAREAQAQHEAVQERARALERQLRSAEAQLCAETDARVAAEAASAASAVRYREEGEAGGCGGAGAGTTESLAEEVAQLLRKLAAASSERDSWRQAHSTLQQQRQLATEEAEGARQAAAEELARVRVQLQAAVEAQGATGGAYPLSEGGSPQDSTAGGSCVASDGAIPATPVASTRRGVFASTPRLSEVLPSPAEALHDLAVAIPSCVRSGGGGGGGGHWSYTVSVSCAGVSYVVLKRYSDFKMMNARLVRTGFGIRGGVVRPLPPARAYLTQDVRFAERRRGELESYLAALAQEPELRSCSELHSFLELGLLVRRSQ